MFFKQSKIRQFRYTPRYYKPAPEEEDDDSPRIKFRRLIERKPVTKRPLWLLLILIFVIIFLLRYFLGTTKTDKQDFKFEDLKIETIE